jgi:CO/xanthine dehydrogenase Mo-binding subunit
VELTLEKDGSLEIKTGMSGGGEWAGIARRILGVEEEKVKVSRDYVLFDCGPDTSSRGVIVLTRMVEQACLSIQKQRFRDPLPITVRRTARAQRNPAWEESFPPPEGVLTDCGGFVRPGCAAAVVEIEIDPVEHCPRIRGVWMSVDGGKIICEDNARRKLRISAVQALGWAYRERIGYTDGIIPMEQFEKFDIFGPSEIPQININFIQSNAEDPSGSKDPAGSTDPAGIGNLPFSCIPAAYAQAVSQAADHVFRSVPLTLSNAGEV